MPAVPSRRACGAGVHRAVTAVAESPREDDLRPASTACARCAGSMQLAAPCARGLPFNGFPQPGARGGRHDRSGAVIVGRARRAAQAAAAAGA